MDMRLLGAFSKLRALVAEGRVHFRQQIEFDRGHRVIAAGVIVCVWLASWFEAASWNLYSLCQYNILDRQLMTRTNLYMSHERT